MVCCNIAFEILWNYLYARLFQKKYRKMNKKKQKKTKNRWKREPNENATTTTIKFFSRAERHNTKLSKQAGKKQKIK